MAGFAPVLVELKACVGTLGALAERVLLTLGVLGVVTATFGLADERFTEDAFGMVVGDVTVDFVGLWVVIGVVRMGNIPEGASLKFSDAAVVGTTVGTHYLPVGRH